VKKKVIALHSVILVVVILRKVIWAGVLALIEILYLIGKKEVLKVILKKRVVYVKTLKNATPAPV